MRAGAEGPRLSPSLSLLFPTAMLVICLGCLGRPAVRPVAETPQRAAAGSRGVEKFGAVETIESEDIAPPGAREARRDASRRTPVYHPLEPGMTLYSLARAYEVPLAEILRANGITDPTKVAAGTPILIPGAERRLAVPLPGEPPAPPTDEPHARIPAAPEQPGRPPAPARADDIPAFLWPLPGTITSSFGARGRHRHHDGVDIDGDQGDAILAAAAGTVVRADNDGRYGRTVILDHGGGVTTLYAHASRLLVRQGDRVEQGDVIAEVGRSGNARGTHLHFEVRREGRPLDPLPLLERGLLIAGKRRGHSSPAPAAASVLPSR